MNEILGEEIMEIRFGRNITITTPHNNGHIWKVCSLFVSILYVHYLFVHTIYTYIVYVYIRHIYLRYEIKHIWGIFDFSLFNHCKVIASLPIREGGW